MKEIVCGVLLLAWIVLGSAVVCAAAGCGPAIPVIELVAKDSRK